MSANGITIVGASAGSGKTYRLTHEVTTAIARSAGDARVPLEGLFAVTFTRKAHAELASRIRHKLVEEGSFDDAMRLPLAYLGTVHAACLRLLQEFALDEGLSPNVDVIGGDPGRLLRSALEVALPPELRAQLDALAQVFELRIDPTVKRVDWHTPVFDIMDLARSNHIAPERLPEMATRSLEGLMGLLPKPVSDGARIDDALVRELELAHKALERLRGGKVSPEPHIAHVEGAMQRLRDGELPWSGWAKLAKFETQKAFSDVVAPVREVAVRFEEHPRFHEQLRALTTAIFEAARLGLAAYADWKGRRRVVDYVDMLDRAHSLLDNPRVRDELARRLKLIVVDEFQDTSPIQLALFVRLHALAQRSVWVGDRKQCIFEYAGADPTLMDKVASWVGTSGGSRERLAANYRSRPELVRMCSALFASALAKHRFTRDDVEVRSERDAKASAETVSALGKLPPLGLWCLETKNNAADAEAIAEGVRRILASPESTPVVDRGTRAVRPVRPGDVAILVATNELARRLATSLHARGIRAAVARAGLLGTPEGRLVDSSLRWLHDPGDSLAAATIDALTGFDGASPDAWLEARIRSVRASPAASEPPAGWRKSLAEVRDSIGALSPAEALDAVISAVGAIDLCARWPDAPQRVANLDALRALAAAYEDRCAEQREAGTIAGLLRYFDDLREERLQRDEKLASDDQHVPTDDGAVVICTYHKSKGLEWPVVVLASLDRDARRHAFDVRPESDGDGFDPTAPLAKRWIRYWPWPLGAQDKAKGRLAEAAAQSAEGRRVAEREDEERKRLLYVGFTRARDHLVLAVRCKPNKSGTVVESDWLDSLTGVDGDGLVALPTDRADATTATTTIRCVDGTLLAVPTRVMRLQGDGEVVDVERPTTRRWFASGVKRVVRPAYRVRPSDEVVDWPLIQARAAQMTVGRIERLPSAVVLDADKYASDVLGDAVHDFFAADVPGLSEEERLERARRLLAGASMLGVIRPESVVRASDQLRAWVAEKWPDAKWHREAPIAVTFASEHGPRRLDGSIDLLLETAEGLVVIDHKTFPGTGDSAVRSRAYKYAMQLATYASVLEQVDGRKVIGTFVHFPIGGVVVECLLPTAEGA